MDRFNRRAKEAAEEEEAKQKDKAGQLPMKRMNENPLDKSIEHKKKRPNN